MVWSGYAVLTSGKTDSVTKLNNNPGCLPGSTFVYSEVFKLDFSPAFFSLGIISLISILAFCMNILLGSVTPALSIIRPRLVTAYVLNMENHELSRQSPHAAQSMLCVSRAR
ncbi:hypothetical protein Tco_0167212 [Tanacetum coccineum]